MKTEEQRNFDKEAAQWDAKAARVKLVAEISAAIIREIKPTRDMDVLDFGCGTGLLMLAVQPLVKSVTGADNSQGMLSVLEGKIREQGLTNAYAKYVDFEKGGRIEGSYDLIVSSMALHHVRDTAGLFAQWHALLRPEGRVCFADLDTEDGSFHPDNAGVFHFGFDRNKVKDLLREAGFHDTRDLTATTMMRDVAGGGEREFSIFLISAKK